MQEHFPGFECEQRVPAMISQISMFMGKVALLKYKYLNCAILHGCANFPVLSKFTNQQRS